MGFESHNDDNNISDPLSLDMDTHWKLSGKILRFATHRHYNSVYALYNIKVQWWAANRTNAKC